MRFRYRYAMLLALMMLAAACAGGRAEILSRTLAGVNAGRDAFTAYDSQHQTELVEAATSKDAGAAALADYRKKRRPAELAEVAAYGALAAASVDLTEAALTSAAKAAADFIAALRQLGVLQ